MTSFVKQETLDKDFVSPSVWFPKMLTNTCRDGVCLWITIQAFICKVWFTCSLQLSRQVSVSSLLFARNLYLHEMMVYLCFSCLEVCFLFLWHSFIHSQPDLLFSRHSVKRRPQREASLHKNIMIMTFEEQRVTLEISNCFSSLCSPFPHITMLERIRLKITSNFTLIACPSMRKRIENNVTNECDCLSVDLVFLCSYHPFFEGTFIDNIMVFLEMRLFILPLVSLMTLFLKTRSCERLRTRKGDLRERYSTRLFFLEQESLCSCLPHSLVKKQEGRWSKFRGDRCWCRLKSIMKSVLESLEECHEEGLECWR